MTNMSIATVFTKITNGDNLALNSINCILTKKMSLQEIKQFVLFNEVCYGSNYNQNTKTKVKILFSCCLLLRLVNLRNKPTK
jgi:hypothetical protein